MSTLKKGLLPVAAIGVCCALAACGSSSSSSSTTSASAATGSTTKSGPGDPAQRAALAACLKKHGLTLPSRPPGSRPPGSRPPGSGGYGGGPRFFGGGNGRGFAPNPKLRAALQACGGGRFRGGPPRNSATFRASLTKYVACVRQHGYDLPKPNFSGKGSVFPSSIQSNPKFQAASRACQSLLARPGGTPGRPSSAQTTTTSKT
jgi:hypothetical protein